MILQELVDKKLTSPPEWLPNNVQNLSIMGSMAYGVNTDDSDFDLYGWCIPPKTVVFPHLTGHIAGFGKAPPNFKNWQDHHVQDPQANGGKGREYDFSIHNIVNYFQLLMDNNPNIIDSLFVPVNCILHSTHVSNLVRDNRHMFLHKGCWHKFKGYAYSQLHKSKVKHQKAHELRRIEDELGIDNSTTLEHAESLYKARLEATELFERSIKASLDVWGWVKSHFYIDHYGLEKAKKDLDNWTRYINTYRKLAETKTKRFDKVKSDGQDNKFLYHVVRLMSEVEQILSEGDLDLQEKGRREHMKAIRAGDVPDQEIRDWFSAKEKDLEALYRSSDLPYKPDEQKVKALLMNCLEHHYGSLEKCVSEMSRSEVAVEEIRKVLETYA